MASLALFIALAGSAFAVSKIDDRGLAPNSIPGTWVKKNSPVPSAALADSSLDPWGKLRP